MAEPGLDASTIRQVQDALFSWYETHERSLAWRHDINPYATFVSEIMLQQTGVERVRPAFARFIAAFPDFEALAGAPTVEVLRAWAGLGYNRRAIWLQECARIISRDHGGVLPRLASDLARLPGVGPYTVAAIRSFVYGDDVVAFDTNVRRVVSRLWFGAVVAEREVQLAATALLPSGKSSAWNQALMDFGSLQCVADRPPCLICPVRQYCQAFASNSIAAVPKRIAEKSEPYLGSRRYIRGRIVAILRDQPNPDPIPLADLEMALTAACVALDRESLLLLLTSLAADHLCKLIVTAEMVFIAPPD